jgi:ribulose 1,5-bisphosphate carboxylase large subunit-like protein
VCKSYIPTVNESDAEDDLIGAGLLTAMDDLRAKLATALTLTTSTATWVARIWKLIEVSPGVFARVPFIRAITKSVSELFVACQRRRRPKVF